MAEPSGAPAPPQNALANPAGQVMQVRTPGVAAHEVLNQGQTQIGLHNRANETLQSSAAEQTEFAKKAALHQAMGARVAEDASDARVAQAAADKAAEQKMVSQSASAVKQASAGIGKEDKGFWADQSTGGKIGMILAMGLSRLGAGIGHQQDTTLPMLQAVMDQDLKTKQMNNQKGIAAKDAAQEQFNNTVKQIGLAPASDAYAAAMRDKVAAQAAQVTASVKLPEIEANGAALRAKLSAEKDEYMANSVLKHVAATKAADKYALPGNPIPVSGEKAFGALEKRQENATEQQGKLDVANAAQAGKAAQQTAEGTKFVAEKAQAANIPGTLASLDAAASELKKGNTKGIGVTGSLVHKAIGDLGYSAIYGQDASQREQDWTMLKSEVMHTLTGAGMGPEERKTYNTMLEGAGNPAARIHAIKTSRQAVERKMNSIKAGAGVEAAAQFDSNLRDISGPQVDAVPVK